MLTVNIHEAKTHLSRLVERAAKGESFIIAKAGHPLVKVVPLQPGEGGAPPRLGFLTGEIRVPDDFDRMGQDEIEVCRVRSAYPTGFQNASPLGTDCSRPSRRLCWRS